MVLTPKSLWLRRLFFIFLYVPLLLPLWVPYHIFIAGWIMFEHMREDISKLYYEYWHR